MCKGRPYACGRGSVWGVRMSALEKRWTRERVTAVLGPPGSRRITLGLASKELGLSMRQTRHLLRLYGYDRADGGERDGAPYAAGRTGRQGHRGDVRLGHHRHHVLAGDPSGSGDRPPELRGTPPTPRRRADPGPANHAPAAAGAGTGGRAGGQRRARVLWGWAAWR